MGQYYTITYNIPKYQTDSSTLMRTVDHYLVTTDTSTHKYVPVSDFPSISLENEIVESDGRTILQCSFLEHEQLEYDITDMDLDPNLANFRITAIDLLSVPGLGIKVIDMDNNSQIFHVNSNGHLFLQDTAIKEITFTQQKKIYTNLQTPGNESLTPYTLYQYHNDDIQYRSYHDENDTLDESIADEMTMLYKTIPPFKTTLTFWVSLDKTLIPKEETNIAFPEDW